MKYAEKQQSIKMRKEGKSIKEIARILHVSKASVSVWVRNVQLSEKVISKLKQRGTSADIVERRRLTRLSNEDTIRAKQIQDASEEVFNLSKKELFIIGVMLYWAEGGKTKRGLVRVANSDPKIIQIMMKFFRIICEVPESKFRGHIHIHSHMAKEKAEVFWSEISGIPVSQFFKTYSKPSKASLGKKDSIPFGTFEICICDTRLFLRIKGWMNGIYDKLMQI